MLKLEFFIRLIFKIRHVVLSFWNFNASISVHGLQTKSKKCNIFTTFVHLDIPARIRITAYDICRIHVNDQPI